MTSTLMVAAMANTFETVARDWLEKSATDRISDASLIRHVRSRVADYLALSTIDQVLGEFNQLNRLLARSR